jgi:hypothetical protein
MPDGTNHHGWLHGLSYAEIAQRASLEEILESSDKLMMLAVQHNEVRFCPAFPPPFLAPPRSPARPLGTQDIPKLERPKPTI